MVGQQSRFGRDDPWKEIPQSVGCAFRGMAATDSDLTRPPIPIDGGQSFEEMIVIAG